MSELKDCPFCGGEAEYDNSEDGFEWICCASCGARGASRKLNFNDNFAVDKWNTRPNDVDNWISCDERLPEENIEYLIYSDGDTGVAKYWPEIGKWLAGDVRFVQGQEITHWMKLPEQPQTDKEDV